MSEKPISPLRRRMIEDMTVRNFVEKTHNDYSFAWRPFTPPYLKAGRTEGCRAGIRDRFRMRASATLANVRFRTFIVAIGPRRCAACGDIAPSARTRANSVVLSESCRRDVPKSLYCGATRIAIGRREILQLFDHLVGGDFPALKFEGGTLCAVMLRVPCGSRGAPCSALRRQ